MKSKTPTFMILGVLVLVVGITEYVRVTKMIPIQRHEKEMERARTIAIAEETHRREMSQLFEKATQREISTSTRIQLAQRELERLDSAISTIDIKLTFISVGNTLEPPADLMARFGPDPVEREAAEQRSAKRIEENNKRVKENRQRLQNEKAHLREIRLKVSKQRDDAMTEHGEALADLTYAKKELAKLGVVVK